MSAPARVDTTLGSPSDTDLDRQIDLLIARIVTGAATPDELKQFRALSAQRIDHMQPRFVGRANARHNSHSASGLRVAAYRAARAS